MTRIFSTQPSSKTLLDITATIATAGDEIRYESLKTNSKLESERIKFGTRVVQDIRIQLFLTALGTDRLSGPDQKRS